MFKPNCWTTPSAVLIGICLTLVMPIETYADTQDDQSQERLARGEVLLDTHSIGPTKYVSGKILILEQPEKVWPVLVNPYQFQGDICDRMRELDVLLDQPDLSRLRMSINCGLFPRITYEVESKYVPHERIDFRRTAGAFRNFTGFWALDPTCDRKGTIVTFALFVEPDIPIPQWLIRQGIKLELPQTLQNLRKRVATVTRSGKSPVGPTLLAATVTLPPLK